jgi:hypothetical protein
VFSGSSVCVIDNFKALFFAKDGKAKKKGAFNLDRGYEGEFRALFDAVKSGRSPVAFEEYVNTTLTTFAVIDALKTGKPQTL